MRWIAIILVVLVVGGLVASKLMRPASVEDSPAAKAFVDAERAFQATVIDGPPAAFSAAAAKLGSAAMTLVGQLHGDDAAAVLAEQLGFIHGVLSRAADVASSSAMRRTMGQTVHERITKLALAPLPYPADPALSAVNAKASAAIIHAPLTLDQWITKLQAAADRVCACKDRACVTSTIQTFQSLGEPTQGHVPSETQKATIDALVTRMRTCTKQVPQTP